MFWLCGLENQIYLNASFKIRFKVTNLQILYESSFEAKKVLNKFEAIFFTFATVLRQYSCHIWLTKPEKDCNSRRPLQVQIVCVAGILRNQARHFRKCLGFPQLPRYLQKNN